MGGGGGGEGFGGAASIGGGEGAGGAHVVSRAMEYVSSTTAVSLLAVVMETLSGVMGVVDQHWLRFRLAQT